MFDYFIYGFFALVIAVLGGLLIRKEDYKPVQNAMHYSLNTFAKVIHEIRRNKGFYDDALGQGDRQFIGLQIAGIHSEVSELYEAFRRDPTALCDKRNGMTCEEEELADIIIRTLDLAHFRGVDITKALNTKVQYDSTRPIKHGKAF